MKKARLAEFVPQECLPENYLGKKEPTGFFDNIKSFFKYSPSSKACLEYQEAIMINEFIKVTPQEVVTYTILQTIRPFITATGEFMNEFYVGLAKDLSFYQYIPLFAFFSVVLVLVVVLVLILCFCGEFSFFGIKLKKSERPKVSEKDIEEKVMLKLKANLVKKVPELEIKTLTIEGIASSIKASQDKSLQEIDELKSQLYSTNKPAAITDGSSTSKGHDDSERSVTEMLGCSYDSEGTIASSEDDSKL